MIYYAANQKITNEPERPSSPLWPFSPLAPGAPGGPRWPRIGSRTTPDLCPSPLPPPGQWISSSQVPSSFARRCRRAFHGDEAAADGEDKECFSSSWWRLVVECSRPRTTMQTSHVITVYLTSTLTTRHALITISSIASLLLSSSSSTTSQQQQQQWLNQSAGQCSALPSVTLLREAALFYSQFPYIYIDISTTHMYYKDMSVAYSSMVADWYVSRYAKRPLGAEQRCVAVAE